MNSSISGNLVTISVSDVQYEALEKLGRELTDEELFIAQRRLESGIFSSINIVYNSIFNELNEKSSKGI